MQVQFEVNSDIDSAAQCAVIKCDILSPTSVSSVLFQPPQPPKQLPAATGLCLLSFPALHCPVLCCVALLCILLRCIALRCAALRSLSCIALHCNAVLPSFIAELPVLLY